MNALKPLFPHSAGKKRSLLLGGNKERAKIQCENGFIRLTDNVIVVFNGPDAEVLRWLWKCDYLRCQKTEDITSLFMFHFFVFWGTPDGAFVWGRDSICHLSSIGYLPSAVVLASSVLKFNEKMKIFLNKRGKFQQWRRKDFTFLPSFKN